MDTYSEMVQNWHRKRVSALRLSRDEIERSIRRLERIPGNRGEGTDQAIESLVTARGLLVRAIGLEHLKEDE